MQGAIGRHGAEAMNAPNPSSSGDRDLEALRRAQRAHEPSMEEILASIRSIIADDRETPAPSAPVQKPAAASGPQIVYANDSLPTVRAVTPPPQMAPAAPIPATPVAPPPPRAAVEPRVPAASVAPSAQTASAQTAPVAPPAQTASAAPLAGSATSTPKIVWEKPAPVAQAEVALPPEPREEERFTSPTTDAAVAASFNALSESVAMQSSEMIEGLMREMLRPMLKSWLDDNLPSLVERLVRAEIQRVARGGR
jgi:cell pole-organizing protein PopZ